MRQETVAPPYTEVVQKCLKKAKKLAKPLAAGETVSVTLPLADQPVNILYVDLIGPLSKKAPEFGLDFNTAEGWTFTFTKET